ncbi:GLUT4 regulating protein TUG-domain-containing protein [Podospora appendiculata]|uniref:GLUT4 regulating protein TUG-domain-containing protein n=1 Tax=Podospora appendiculata TaxID=314037 RepID=A0AAE1CHN1_9PEZI|nr:GLUT4 regulating protein TUG-domain-containing protein [Podospora appendiculata]
MSAHVEVISTEFKRVKITVTPSSYLIDVLHEACRRLNVSGDKYLLKHKQKLVDLSGPFRTSGLVSGAKLELVQKSSSPSVVSIALDVGGERYTKKLPSDMTLWQVLRQFESTETQLKNITGRGSPKTTTSNSGSGSGQLYHEAPVVNILGKEYVELADLQKTLSQCGINGGSIVLRVTFRDTDTTLYQAMETIAGYLNEVEPEPQPKPAETQENVVSTLPPAVEQQEPTSTTPATTAQVASPEPSSSTTPPPPPKATNPNPTPSPDAMDIDAPPSSTDPLQPTTVFSAPTSSTPAAAKIEVHPSVYEPTIAHATLHQRQLEKRGQNTRLKSDEELAAAAAAEAASLAAIKKVDIKVRFPDMTLAQWTLDPTHTGAFLYQAVRGAMAHPDQPFKLVRMSGDARAAAAAAAAQLVIRDDARLLIKGYGLKARELLNVSWDDGASAEARSAPSLKASVASRAQEIVVPVPQEEPEEDAKSEVAGPSGTKPAVKGNKNPFDKEKLGKFFKGLGGKK